MRFKEEMLSNLVYGHLSDLVNGGLGNRKIEPADLDGATFCVEVLRGLQAGKKRISVDVDYKDYTP